MLIRLVRCAGSQVPAGQDWRRWFFPHLKRALILLPILSKSFFFSAACEDELTYAFDRERRTIPVVCDPEYIDVLANPEEYTEMDEDIELRAPKLEVLLHSGTKVLPSPVTSLRL